MQIGGETEQIPVIGSNLLLGEHRKIRNKREKEAPRRMEVRYQRDETKKKAKRQVRIDNDRAPILSTRVRMETTMASATAATIVRTGLSSIFRASWGVGRRGAGSRLWCCSASNAACSVHTLRTSRDIGLGDLIVHALPRCRTSLLIWRECPGLHCPALLLLLLVFLLLECKLLLSIIAWSAPSARVVCAHVHVPSIVAHLALHSSHVVSLNLILHLLHHCRVHHVLHLRGRAL